MTRPPRFPRLHEFFELLSTGGLSLLIKEESMPKSEAALDRARFVKKTVLLHATLGITKVGEEYAVRVSLPHQLDGISIILDYSEEIKAQE